MGMSILLTRESLKYYLTTDATMTRPTGWEVSLHTGDPGVDGLDNEVEDATYTRQTVVLGVEDTSFGEPVAQNTDLIVFPAATEAYTVTHLVLWDTAGNILVPQALRATKTIQPAEQAQISPGEIKIGAIQ